MQAAPASAREVFFAFNRLALQGFGGVMPIAQYELVERRGWVSRERFLELMSLCQVMPGPNIVNMSLMLGDGWFGWRGALAAFAGMLFVPSFVVLALALAYAHWADEPHVAGAVRGMGAVAAGLIASTAIKLAGSLKSNPMDVKLGWLIALLTFATIALLHWPLLWVFGALGVPSVFYAWRKTSA